MPNYTLRLATPQRKRVFAQLRSINTLKGAQQFNENVGQVIINFPAMPDVIELARRANYNNMAANSPANPDGFHIYRSTDPLKIPISFSAHAFDVEYTGKDGPVALLQMAAGLHALTLPIVASALETTNSTAFPNMKQAPDTTNNAPAAKIGVATTGATNTEPSFTSRDFYNANNQVTHFPVPCILDIMLARWGTVEYGIQCYGFVEDVSVKLKGPWLQGRAATDSLDDLRNMPSIAEYAFTFVHQPGYTNDYVGNRIGDRAASLLGLQAMAADVYKRLYNQVELDKLSSKAAGTGTADNAMKAVNLLGQ
jgi:hypothetical protein